MEAMEPTSIKEWKKRSSGIELNLPSGNVCLVRVKPLTAYITSGQFPKSALKLVQETTATGKAPSEAELVRRAQDDPEMLVGMLTLMDHIVIECVIEPKVYPSVPDEERDEDRLYVDEVDYADKVAIMAFTTGGVRDLSRFRSEPEDDVATPSDERTLPLSPERPDRTDV